MFYFLFALLFCLVVVTLLWAYTLKSHNAGIIDVVWSLLIALPALGYFLALSDGGMRHILVLIAIILWGIRLAGHIAKRYFFEGKEDTRYSALRARWGAAHQIRMLRFYWIQASTAAVFSIPFLLMFSDPRQSLNVVEVAGLGIWIVAFIGETCSDYQLASFKQNSGHHGQVCRVGLWNYSRHPNYFFEWLIWVSYFVIASQVSWGFLTIIYPVMMFYFLNKVTGIPLAEEQSLKSKDEAYKKYQKEVNAFFPWFPKKGEG